MKEHESDEWQKRIVLNSAAPSFTFNFPNLSDLPNLSQSFKSLTIFLNLYFLQTKIH